MIIDSRSSAQLKQELAERAARASAYAIKHGTQPATSSSESKATDTERHVTQATGHVTSDDELCPRCKQIIAAQALARKHKQRANAKHKPSEPVSK